MRTLIAGMLAAAALAVAAPSFAQQEDPAATSAPAPATKAKHQTAGAANCQTSKTSSAKNACLKKMHAQAGKSKMSKKATKKPSTKAPAAKPQPGDAAQAAPSRAQPSAAANTPLPAQTGPVAVPALPQKTI